MIRVLIADDHTILGWGLRSILAEAPLTLPGNEMIVYERRRVTHVTEAELLCVLQVDP